MADTNALTGLASSAIDSLFGKGTADAVLGALGLDQKVAQPGPLDRFGSRPGSSYTVKPGDTLSEIAARHGTSWQTLARINGLSNPDQLRIGQQLRLPAGSVSSHVVRSGDTLSRIAEANGTTVAALRAANPQITNINRIYPGQIIQIGGQASPAPRAPRSDGATPVERTSPAATVTGGRLTPDATSLRAADIAEQRAMGKSSQGKCYAWVKDALLAAGATPRRLVGVPAKDAGAELVRSGFVNVLGQPGYDIKSPYDAPKGAVLVYGAAPSATDRNRIYGHIEIRTENGFASDYFSRNARTGPASNGLDSDGAKGRVLIGVYIKPATGGMQPAPVRPTSDPVPLAANPNDLISRLGSVITIGEGNYESYNTGTKGVAGDKVGHSFLNPRPGTVTNMTINEIIATQGLSGYDRNRMFATGKYQTTIETLKLAKAAMGLTGNEKYTPEMQERVFREFLIEKAGGGKLADFVLRGRGTIEQAQLAAAKEWASIAVPAGYTNLYGVVSDGTISYYQKPGQNSASQTATRELRALLVAIDSRR